MSSKDILQFRAREYKAKMNGHVYRHFKGNYYEVLNVGVHSETEELVVIYKSTNAKGDDDVWVRPLKNFLSEVDHKKYPDVEQKMRFERVD